MKKKKVFRITEKQLKDIMLREVQLNADEPLIRTKDPKRAAQETLDTAQSQGVPTEKGCTVGFSSDALKQVGVTEGKKNCYSKKQLLEARLKMLRENSKAYKKSDLLKK